MPTVAWTSGEHGQGEAGVCNPKGSSDSDPKYRFGLLLGATAYLSINLFRLLQAPYLLGGDQVYFWLYAQRMLLGERIYRDFFQFTPPGTDLIYLTGFKLFGPQIWVTNAVVFALGLALCWVCFSIASEIVDRSGALLAAALFVVAIYGKLLNGTHHVFSMLAVMYAVKVMMGRPAPARTLGTGALLGLASFFTQTHGAMALVAMSAFLLWEALKTGGLGWRTLRNPVLLVAGYIAGLLLLSAHLIAVEGLRQLWYFQVIYVREHLARGSESGFLGLPPAPGRFHLFKIAQYVVIYVLIALTYLLALLRCWRERKNPDLRFRPVMLLCCVGIALLLGMASDLNWVRVYAVSMPAVILLVWLASDQLRSRQFAAVVWSAIGCLAVTQTVGHYRAQKVLASLPGGIVAVDPPTAEKLRWLAQHTRPGDYFFQGAWPGMYLPLGLRNPGYFESVEPANRLQPADIFGMVRGLEQKRVAYILWTERLNSRGQLVNGAADKLEPLRIYVRSRYRVVKVFEDGDSILRRNE